MKTVGGGGGGGGGEGHSFPLKTLLQFHSGPTYSRPNRKLQSLYVRNQLAALHLPVLTQWTRVYKHLFFIRNIFNLRVRHTSFHICYDLEPSTSYFYT